MLDKWLARHGVITPRRAIHEAKRAAAIGRRIKQLWSQATLSRAFWSIADPAEGEEHGVSPSDSGRRAASWTAPTLRAVSEDIWRRATVWAGLMAFGLIFLWTMVQGPFLQCFNWQCGLLTEGTKSFGRLLGIQRRTTMLAEAKARVAERRSSRVRTGIFQVWVGPPRAGLLRFRSMQQDPSGRGRASDRGQIRSTPRPATAVVLG